VPPTTTASVAAAATAAAAAAAAAAATPAEREAAAVQELIAAAVKSSSDVTALSADVAYTPHPAPSPRDCAAVLRLYMHASSFAQQAAAWQQHQHGATAATVRSTQDKLKQSTELSRQLGDVPAAAALQFLQLQLQRCAMWQVLHSVPRALNDWQALDLWYAAVAANGRSAAALLNQVQSCTLMYTIFSFVLYELMACLCSVCVTSCWRCVR
jgi:hypothetical protein